MIKAADDLQLHVYNFWDHYIGLRSNSGEVLSHFRFVYDRFFCGSEFPEADSGGRAEKPVPCTIEAVDSIAENQILSLNDGNEFYELRCINIHEFDRDYYGEGSVPDPIAFITYLFLKNTYRIIRGYQLFHAAALSHNGQALILPALERMGKTTLSVQLVQSGMKFLSDEVACIDPERKVIKPYPRKLNLSEASCAMLHLPQWPDEWLRRSGAVETEWSVDIEQIVPGSLSPERPLTHIVFLRGFGETPRLDRVSASNALFKLYKFSFNPSPEPASQLFGFAPVLDGITCCDLVCAEPRKTADLLINFLDNRDTDYNDPRCISRSSPGYIAGLQKSSLV